MQIETILYPTDFSPCSRRALDMALLLSEHFGAKLHMLNALVLFDEASDGVGDFPGLEGLVAHHRAVAELSMRELLAEHAGDPLEIVQVHRRGYAAASVITDYAIENDVDLVVMGTHGRRGLRRFVIGSVAEEVIRESVCPVLTLRGEGESKGAESLSLNRLLAPVDFSAPSRRSLRTAVDLARRWDATVVAVHVVEPVVVPTFYDAVVTYGTAGELARRAAEELDALVDELGADDVSIVTRVIEGRPGLEISSYAETDGADLIVLGTRGNSGLERVLMGSVATEVLRHAACPVLTLPATE